MIEGFFSQKEMESKSRPNGKIYSCASCGLYKNADSPKMRPTGGFRKGIMNIGPFPSVTDDKKGAHFQGQFGRTVESAYAKLGIDLYEDCVNLNALNCWPGSETAKLSYNIACCRKIVIATIEEYQPKVIVLFGMQAVESVIGHRWKRSLDDIGKWRGWTIPDRDFNAWICPVLYPDLDKMAKEFSTIWNQDIERALSKVNEDIPEYVEPEIEIITDLSVLDDIKSDTIAFDYEATGIKPHASGHKIICASVADSPDHAYSFLLPGSKNARQPFVDLLGMPLVRKMAHNMKYEDTWSVVRLRQRVYGWYWDSMLAAHILDNRPGITSLKFQTYVHFGIVDYEAEIAPYLRGEDDKNGNAINNIDEVLKSPSLTRKLLEYCGMDSINEYRLALLQQELMQYKPVYF